MDESFFSSSLYLETTNHRFSSGEERNDIPMTPRHVGRQFYNFSIFFVDVPSTLMGQRLVTGDFQQPQLLDVLSRAVGGVFSYKLSTTKYPLWVFQNFSGFD